MNKGFHYMGKVYAWHGSELYCLPFRSGRNFYGQKKCAKWLDKGYYLGKHRKSFKQLESMTTEIDQCVTFQKHRDTPF